ncbi:MAG: hypothetical protein ACRD0G_06205 [Acidimicrobiales bacterium]
MDAREFGDFPIGLRLVEFRPDDAWLMCHVYVDATWGALIDPASRRLLSAVGEAARVRFVVSPPVSAELLAEQARIDSSQVVGLLERLGRRRLIGFDADRRMISTSGALPSLPPALHDAVGEHGRAVIRQCDPLRLDVASAARLPRWWTVVERSPREGEVWPVVDGRYFFGVWGQLVGRGAVGLASGLRRYGETAPGQPVNVEVLARRLRVTPRRASAELFTLAGAGLVDIDASTQTVEVPRCVASPSPDQLAANCRVAAAHELLTGVQRVGRSLGIDLWRENGGLDAPRCAASPPGRRIQSAVVVSGW